MYGKNKTVQFFLPHSVVVVVAVATAAAAAAVA